MSRLARMHPSTFTRRGKIVFAADFILLIVTEIGPQILPNIFRRVQEDFYPVSLIGAPIFLLLAEYARKKKGGSKIEKGDVFAYALFLSILVFAIAKFFLVWLPAMK